MRWSEAPGPGPHRSEGELLEAVQRRAGAIHRRRRRRAALIAGAAGMASVLFVVAVAVAGTRDRSTELRVVGDGSLTTSVLDTSTVLTTTVLTTTVPTTTAPPPTIVPPTTVGQVPTTTRATATTVPPTTTTSSTVPPPLRPCDPTDVVVTATPDRTTYPVGATAKVLVAGQNRSSRACAPIDPKVELRDSAGAVVFTGAVADAFTAGSVGGPQPSWDPGATHSITFDVPTICPDTKPCPAGTYLVIGTFDPFRSGPVPITLV